MDIKDKVGKEAASLIKNGMTVGIGSGTTAACFIRHLAARCLEGLSISGVPTSKASAALAQKLGIPLINPNEVLTIDITVDGADQIDPHKQMIKGLGGALVREKIIASMSKEMIVIVDETKCVHQLGHILPVEIIPFAYLATLHHLEKMGYTGKWRLGHDHAPYITDNGNWILDVVFSKPCLNPREDHEKIIHLPGVVDTGFFFDLAGRVIVGFFDGQIVIKE